MRGGAVARSDGGLKVILAHGVAGGGETKVVDAALNHRLVPTRTILLVQTEDISSGVGARTQTAGIEQHEREERVGLGQARGGMLEEQQGEADGFVAKIRAHQVLAARGFVAFIEKQVDRSEHAAQTRGEFVRIRHGEG
jgi:hypothetical protein